MTTSKDIQRMSFSLYTQLSINDKGEISLIEEENKCYVVYAILVDDNLVYIGKTNNLKKRINYYRTSYNRKNKTSDSKKSEIINLWLMEGKKVEFYYRQCFNISVKNDLGTMVISTMDLEEPLFIKMFNPSLNTQHKRKK